MVMNQMAVEMAQMNGIVKHTLVRMATSNVETKNLVCRFVLTFLSQTMPTRTVLCSHSLCPQDLFLLKAETVCDGIVAHCHDRSDEMCSHQCAPDNFKGRYTMKVWTD